MSDLVREGFRDLSRRLRIVWIWGLRLRVRRALFHAEAQLGWLGWEQTEFFDEAISAEVKKVQEFENVQASLLNVSAEISEKKVALDQELAREKERHEQARISLAAERAPAAGQLQAAEAARQQKLVAVERFDKALEEINGLEKRLETRTQALMKVRQPTAELHAEARDVSDQLGRLPAERKLVIADRLRVSDEAARLEPGIAELRTELQRIDTAMAEEDERFSATASRIAGEVRKLEREQKKSSLDISHLDRKKKKPYQVIGACLADDGIAPLNQPQLLEEVFKLREKDALLSRNFMELETACAAADTGLLAAFYGILVSVLFVLALLCAQIHR